MSTAVGEAQHIPVLRAEVVEALGPKDSGTYVDGTFGAGGYTVALLDAAACVVWAIDRDPEALVRGETLFARYPGRLHLVHGRFGDMVDLLANRGVAGVDGIALALLRRDCNVSES